MNGLKLKGVRKVVISPSHEYEQAIKCVINGGYASRKLDGCTWVEMSLNNGDSIEIYYCYYDGGVVREPYFSVEDVLAINWELTYSEDHIVHKVNCNCKDDFDCYLQWASENVKTWPEWKQNLLGSPILEKGKKKK